MQILNRMAKNYLLKWSVKKIFCRKIQKNSQKNDAKKSKFFHIFY